MVKSQRACREVPGSTTPGKFSGGLAEAPKAAPPQKGTVHSTGPRPFGLHLGALLSLSRHEGVTVKTAPLDIFPLWGQATHLASCSWQAWEPILKHRLCEAQSVILGTDEIQDAPNDSTFPFFSTSPLTSP